MSEFYDNKQKELNEEVEFLIKRRNEIEKLSNAKRRSIICQLNELEELKNEEAAIIRRLEFLNRSELGIYRVFLPYHGFISSVNNDIASIRDHVKYMLRLDDENE